MKIIFLILWVTFFIVGPTCGADELVVLDTRPGVTQQFLLLEPENPVVSVILFAGGHGNLNLKAESGAVIIGWGKNNFLVRERERFLNHGFTVAVIDAPSDRRSRDGMFGGFRNSENHVKDIDQVIAYLKKKKNVPVWLVGTSRGTESAAYVAIYSRQLPAGVVLSSSITEENAKGDPLTELALDKIITPVLIVAHSDDECWVTRPEGSDYIKERLSKSRLVSVKYFEGGDKQISRDCGARSPHGYLGIEEQVVSYMSSFIKKN